MSVSKHAREAVSHVVTKGDVFLKDHPLFGGESDMPKTAQRLKDLAQQINDGLITSDEAEVLAADTADAEFGTLSQEKQDAIMARAADELMKEVLG